MTLLLVEGAAAALAAWRVLDSWGGPGASVEPTSQTRDVGHPSSWRSVVVDSAFRVGRMVGLGGVAFSWSLCIMRSSSRVTGLLRFSASPTSARGARTP